MNSSTSLETASSYRLRVIKVGGSLFTLPALKPRLMDWSATISDGKCVNVWIAGGGGFVDEVRNWQTRHGLDADIAHRISIGLMSQTAELLQSMFLAWPLLRDIQRLDTGDLSSSPNVIFDCSQWALDNMTLERNWETTSDTISLRLATAVGASDLILLKSRLPKSDRVNEAIEDGLIDRNFATGCNEASRLRPSVVNLRESDAVVEMHW